MLLRMAWRNIWRNRRRTLITCASIVFAVVLCVLMDSVKKGLLDRMKDSVVGLYTGYVQVHGQGYWDTKTWDHSFGPSDTLRQQIQSHPNVLAMVPRLESYTLVASDSYARGTVIVGIDSVRSFIRDCPVGTTCAFFIWWP